MNALFLAAPAVLVLASWQPSPVPSADAPATAKVTGVMVVMKLDRGRGEPAPGVRVTLMAVRRNAEGLLEADLRGSRDCEEPTPPVGREPYGFCTAVTDPEGRFVFAGVKPGLYVLTSSNEAAAHRKLATFGKRAVCDLRAGMTHDVGNVEVEK